MRKLNKKQKDILDSLNVLTLEDETVIEKLEKINMFENLISDANRYLIDKHNERLYKK